MKRYAPALLIFFAALGTMSSCKQAPVACFTVLTPADSIKVGHSVTFNAGCSSDAASYYWDFGNGQFSTTSPTAQIIYDSAASYQVALVVGNSGKSASITKTVVVNP
jgi:PKD repeat protein